jgi:hypothetical protein
MVKGNRGDAGMDMDFDGDEIECTCGIVDWKPHLLYFSLIEIMWCHANITQFDEVAILLYFE